MLIFRTPDPLFLGISNGKYKCCVFWATCRRISRGHPRRCSRNLIEYMGPKFDLTSKSLIVLLFVWLKQRCPKLHQLLGLGGRNTVEIISLRSC